MTAKLENLSVVGGCKTKLFNRGKAKTLPLTQADIKRWGKVQGQLSGGCWEAVVDGRVAVVARIAN